MSDLGAILRKAREQRGYSLDDLQEMTKIRKRYLEAIEEGNYKVLPGNFYVRAFVKNYAEAVGLDADEVLQLYRKEIPASAVQERTAEPQILKPRRASGQTTDRLSKWGFRLLMWSFVIVIAVVVYIFAIRSNIGGEGEIADNTPIGNEDLPPMLDNDADNAAAENAGQEPGNTAGTDNGGENGDAGANAGPDTTPEPEPPAASVTLVEKVNKSTDRYAVTPAGTHTYTLTATGDCWYQIRTGGSSGETVNTATLRSGGSVSVDLEGVVYIKVGNAANVEIQVDGQVLADGDPPGIKKFLIEPSDAAPGAAAQ